MSPHPQAGVEITIEDVRQLTFELYLAQRDIARLQAANHELTQLLRQATAPADGPATDYASGNHPQRKKETNGSEP